MEAAEKPLERDPDAADLSGDKARRIVDAMRASVAKRGTAGSTFDHVARDAGVSRGLLHYYFGTKERLLVEVVRSDTAMRVERLDRAMAGARTVDDVLDVLVAGLEDTIENEPGLFALTFELFSAGRDNPEVGHEIGELFVRIVDHVAEALEHKQREGVLRLRFEARAVASFLLSVGDGYALQRLSSPERAAAHARALAAGVAAARHLLTDE